MTATTQFPYFVCTSTATITSGSLSASGVDLAGTYLRAVVTPADLDATKLTFYGSADGTTYVALKTSAAVAVSMSVVTSSMYFVDDSLPWRGLRWLKTIGNTASTADQSLTYVSVP